jgi:hypothetical protein
MDYYLLGKKPASMEKSPPTEKSDIMNSQPAAELKAAEESAGGPRPGGETLGNSD